eukprot:810309-Amorphochlora_amoeboformis.AAC.2
MRREFVRAVREKRRVQKARKFSTSHCPLRYREACREMMVSLSPSHLGLITFGDRKQNPKHTKDRTMLVRPEPFVQGPGPNYK